MPTPHATSPRPIGEPWALTPEAVLDALGVDVEEGLSPEEVSLRFRRYGPNQLRETRRRGAWRMLWDQLASPIAALLAAATLVSIAFDEHLEALAIAAVLAINTSIGFWTERRAVRSMEALRSLGRVEAHVRRAGSTQLVHAEDLVPGDVVLVEGGDMLTADVRLVSASRLQTDESALTGESLPLDKVPDVLPPDTALPDRRCMLFKGTAVARGNATGVVVATGMHTELGGISALVEEARPEVTPLEARLDQLGRRLIVLTLGIATLVGAASVWGGRDLYLSIEIGLALAIAAVPEGLPIVATVALARGMWRMARRNALVEQLSAVETLGSTSVILADKTGTLTQNRMVVAELALADGTTITLTAEPGETGGFHRDGSELSPDAIPALARALRIAALCSNAELGTLGARGGAHGHGDPTEVALLWAARAGGLEREAVLRSAPEVAEIAFDSETKRMATLHAEEGRVLAAAKGAPETVIPCCTRLLALDGNRNDLSEAGRTDWLRRAEQMAFRGHRVLALAERTDPDAASFAYRDLTLVGLVGMSDPPRTGVREAVDACQAAGIRVVMVTGDHGGTAWHIAAAAGLIDPIDGEAVSFLDARSLPEIAALSEQEEREVLASPVIARATPRQKLELISFYQRHGAVVAMTGDGVNDAPALKKADIGVAMGQRGTQVAREAAAMVLQDDEFGTIVAAVAQGRAIFANIQKFVVYLMSCNVSELLAVAVAALAQGPLPLMPLQILFLNLVTDVFPALALGVGEGSASLMRAPPRRSDEPMIGPRHWHRIGAYGVVIALSVLGALGVARLGLLKSGPEATTISFVTLALAQLWHVFNMRDAQEGVFRNEITRNRWIWGAIGLCVALVVMAVQWPPLSRILSTAPPGIDGWALAVAASTLPLVAGQIALELRRRRLRKQPVSDAR